MKILIQKSLRKGIFRQRGARGLCEETLAKVPFFLTVRGCGSFFLGNRTAEAARKMNGLTKVQLANSLIQSKKSKHIFNR